MGDSEILLEGNPKRFFKETLLALCKSTPEHVSSSTVTLTFEIIKKHVETC